MRIRPHVLPCALAALLGLGSAGAAAQGKPCTLEFYRADNMWANWGRADGYLGAETITVQPGQKRVFATSWSYEKQRNDGTNYYGSHLRRAINRGEGPIRLRLSGPFQIQHKVGSAVQAVLLRGSDPSLDPGQESYFRHDLMEVSCPDAVVHTATAPTPPPPAPVLLSLTGERGTTSSTVTVTVVDAQSGAPLTGQVTINGATGSTGQPITFNACSETFEYQDPRGVTRTRTARVPCEGVVRVSGYAESYFSF